MITTMEVLKSEEFGEIRTFLIDGEMWFVGKDVAKALGYTNTRQALADHVDTEDKRIGDGVIVRDAIGREQRPTIINESGLYSLVFSSKMPSAKQFRQWITAELMERAGASAEPIEKTPKTQVLPCSNGSLEVFSNAEFGTIRTVLIDGEPWFVGKDVAEALGYKETTKAARDKVDSEDRGVSKIDNVINLTPHRNHTSATSLLTPLAP